MTNTWSRLSRRSSLDDLDDPNNNLDDLLDHLDHLDRDLWNVRKYSYTQNAGGRSFEGVT